jgi:hypothetical protein
VRPEETACLVKCLAVGSLVSAAEGLNRQLVRHLVAQEIANAVPPV